MDDQSYLQEMAQTCGIELTDQECQQLLKHLDLVLEKNKVINLTSIRNRNDGIVLHILDSLLLLPYIRQYEYGDPIGHLDTKVGATVARDIIERSADALPDRSQASYPHSLRYLDMGTGAGFPGIPLAICSNASAVLVDSVGKKVTCCNEFIHALDLIDRVAAVHDRLEMLAIRERGMFDLAIARALAPLDVLIEYSTPLVRMNGYLLFTKAHLDEEELQNANKASQICGIARVSRETIELPDGYGHREILLYQKMKASKLALPRKNGEARNKPLVSLYRSH